MVRLVALVLGLFVLGTAPATATTAPIPIRVVVVTLFEVGTDNDGSPARCAQHRRPSTRLSAT